MDDASRHRQEDWERSLQAWRAKQAKEGKIPSVIIDHTKMKNHTPTKKDSPIFTKFLIFLAFAIPIAILGYALYINYLPFGYEKTYTLTIDQDGIISPLSNEIYITNAQGRKLLSLPEGVNGQVNIVLVPSVVLKNALVNVDIQGENVFIATEPDTSSMDWDYDWDFASSIPNGFEGTATFSTEEGCTHFNAYNEETLSLPNSKDLFESGPMTIYTKWKPSQVSAMAGNNQQIVGHFNWELWQGQNNVQFRVGRMNDANGTSYSISYPVNQDFFGKEHEALAIYSPSEEGNGYIELWIDDKVAGREFIAEDVIYKDYNGESPLNLGWSNHNYGNNPYFDGCIYQAKISDEVASNKQITNELFENINGTATIPIIGNGKISSVTLKVSQ